ncbi:MAG TPA: helix-turn-helix domain-containing protein [Ohtaekwangia sp.]|uniref:helix-turn-helix domain-containing protein n=1 Tax=Ohtaekwangia sp. TaxID=2066019 RepID=UPI002F932615
MNENKIMRVLREANGYTQEYIASELGINQNTYSKLESGQTRLTVDRVKKLAELYKIAPEYFLSDGLPIINYNSGPNSHSNSGVIENYNERGDGRIHDLFLQLLSEKDRIIEEKNETILLLKSELSNARKERDRLLEFLNK